MLAESDMPSSLRSVPYISAKVIFDEAKGGDALAIQVTEYVCRYLGKGLACAENQASLFSAVAKA